MNKKITILIVDTDEKAITFLETNLTKDGYKVVACASAKEAIKHAKKELPQMVIMELDLPEMDGIDLCTELRQHKQFAETMIVFYTLKDDDYTQIYALNAGGDDYIIKPSKPRVFLSRVKALLKRHNVAKAESEESELGDFRIDREEYLVYKNGKKILLPRKEFELVDLLFKNPGKVVTRKEIEMKIWGKEIEYRHRTLDVHIRMIRKKLKANYITTIKGMGYRIDMDLFKKNIKKNG